MSLVPTRPLDISALHAALVDNPATSWRSIDVVDTTGSTNSDMVKRANNNLDCDREILLAEYQTNGRGRYTRSFVAPRHSSLSFSALIRIGTVSSSRWPLLPLATGVAVIDGLRHALHDAGINSDGEDVGKGGDVDLSLKWPNDVLCNGKKLAGMLVEMGVLDRTYPDGSSAAAIIPGVGINITQSPAELPVDYATSLAMVLGDPAAERLANCGAKEVIATNTLPIPEEHCFENLTVLSMAPLLAATINEIFDNGSVTALFEGA